MKRQRLVKLRNFLDTEVRKRPSLLFNMGVWATSPFERRDMACNTAACALGHATALWPKHLGLRRHPTQPQFEIWLKNYFKSGIQPFGCLAASIFFNISLPTAEYIFLPQDHRDTRGRVALNRVISRIDEVLAGKRIND